MFQKINGEIGMKKKGKDNTYFYFTILKIIFLEARFERNLKVNDIAKGMGISKQRAYYWIEKMCEEHILKKIGYGGYSITESGKRLYDRYSRFENKQLIRIENMGVSYTIFQGISNIFNQYYWKKNGLKNAKVWSTTVEAHTVKLYKSKDKPYRIEILITGTHGVKHYEAYHDAVIEADTVAGRIENVCDAKMSLGYVTTEPEIAIPSPIASATLIKYEASQIRTNRGIFNRSKGRYADWEVRNLQDAQKIMDMPDDVYSIKEQIQDLHDKMNKIIDVKKGFIPFNSQPLFL